MSAKYLIRSIMSLWSGTRSRKLPFGKLAPRFAIPPTLTIPLPR